MWVRTALLSRSETTQLQRGSLALVLSGFSHLRFIAWRLTGERGVSILKDTALGEQLSGRVL